MEQAGLHCGLASSLEGRFLLLLIGLNDDERVLKEATNCQLCLGWGGEKRARISPLPRSFGTSPLWSMRRIGMYDVRPDQVGWTVFDVETGRAAVLDDLVLIELEHEAADELAALLNRNVYGSRPKRLSRWPLPAASRPQSSQG